jgi:aminoglycoside phosphotransferase (APT) family kinase protein
VLTERDAELARTIAESAGLRPARIEPILHRGSVNHVFDVHGHGGRYVVRFAIDPLRENSYEVEAWCVPRAAAQGVPGPEVVAHGVESGVPYLVETFVDGTPGHTGGLDGWRTLGSYARRVHRIALTADAPSGLFSRFGRDLPRAWRSHLDYNLKSLEPDDPLIDLGVYRREQQPALREVLARLGEQAMSFGLSHGDLSLRNLLLPATGPPVLLDWDTAAAGPTPDGDLLSLLRMHQTEGDPDHPALQAFAEGYGLDLAAVLPRLTDQLVLGHLDLVRWAQDQRPDLLDQTVITSRAGIGRNLR